MSARLEDYLYKKREDLDVETPDDEAVWRNISRSMNNDSHEIGMLKNRIRLLKIRNFAATALILFSLGYIANDVVNRKKPEEKIVLSEINPDLGRMEEGYKKLVSFKTDEVRSYMMSDNKIISQLFTEIRNLDLVYDQALKDLKELGPNDKIINTIFSTYEQKIKLLELIILESNKANSHENNQKINL
jgi:hypothetical protein